MNEKDLLKLTFDKIQNYKETKGVAKNKGKIYRTAKYKAINNNNKECEYIVKIRNDGKIKIKKGMITWEQIHKDVKQEWGNYPKKIRVAINKEWPNLNLAQKNVLAAMATGRFVNNPTIIAVVAGIARKRFRELFPTVQTSREARQIMKQWGKEILEAV